MAVIGPITCRCGLTMRVCEARDAWECRCGMTLDGEVVFLARDRGRPIPDDAYQQGEPWKEPAPGIRISDAWGDIGPIGWEIALVDPATVADNATLERAAIDAFRGSRLHHMERAPPTGGRHLILETGEELRRQQVYALAPLGQEVEAVAGIVQFLSDKLLPGRVWTMGEIPIAPMKKRSEDGCRGVMLGGVMHVVLAAYYFWAPPVAARPYAPGEKMTDRNPDSVIARVVEDTIAAHAPLAEPNLQSVDDKLPGGGSSTFTQPLQKSAPAQPGKQWVVPLPYEERPTPRADGFAQHQVGAAKAALLAPAPPRYPRRTGR